MLDLHNMFDRVRTKTPMNLKSMGVGTLSFFKLVTVSFELEQVFLWVGGSISQLREFANNPIFESLGGESQIGLSARAASDLLNLLNKICTEADTHDALVEIFRGCLVGRGEGKGEWQAKCQLDLHSSVYQATSSLPCTGMIAAFGMTVTILKVLNFELKFRECQVLNLSSFYSKSARIILTIGVEGEYLCLSSVLGRGMLPLSAGMITKCNLSTSIIPCRPL